MKDIKWFQDARFGAFIHWGLYSVAGGLWRGREMEYIGEWIQPRFRIPNSEYAAMAKDFNPVNFNADDMIRRFHDAGMRYLVFTAKHHDGFAMYHSRVSRFNITDATPFRRDPLAELAEACRKYGVRLGIYYSHYLDWHEANGGDPGPDFKLNYGMPWGNDWDFPDFKNKKFNEYFENKVLPQVSELLSNYGSVSLLWLDCGLTIPAELAKKLCALVKKLQPDCLLNGRIGGGISGDFGSLGDNQCPGGASSVPAESAGTLNDTWGFKYNDNNWKPARNVECTLVDMASKGVNYLLNFGPRPDGALPDGSIKVLDSLAEWMKNASPAIHGTSPSPFRQEYPWFRATAAGNRLCLFLVKKADNYRIRGIMSRVVSCSVPFSQNEDCVELLPDSAVLNELRPVILSFESVPVISPRFLTVDGSLILNFPNAELVHGTDAGPVSNIVNIGAASEVLKNTPHSYLSDSGTLSQWQNPNDSAEWDIAFPDGGTFEVSLMTRTRSHGGTWIGERDAEVSFAGKTVRRKLTESRRMDSRCYAAAESVLGELTVRAGENGRVSLRTVRIFSESACNMDAVQLIFREVKAGSLR